MSYSRKYLLIIRNSLKTWSKSCHAPPTGQLSPDVWKRLKSLDLLAPRRGNRGRNIQGQTKDGNRINVVAGTRRAPSNSLSFRQRNYNSLININSAISTSNMNNNNLVIRTEVTQSTRVPVFQKSKVTVAHVNARSLKKREHLVQLRQLAKEKEYGLLAISETWLNSTVTNAEVEIDEYKLSRLDCKRNHAGGVCVYARRSLKTKVLKDLSTVTDSGFHQLWVQIQHRKLKSFLLCVTYRPPDCPVSCFVDVFMDRYLQAMTH